MSVSGIWLGSQESYDSYLQNSIKYAAEQVRYAELELKLREDSEQDLSAYLSERLIDVEGSVGIVSVSGSLTSEESYRNLWFDEVAYSTISNAVNQLLENPAVATIVLALNSPGGDASGISDLGSFLKDAGKIKPIHAWTGKCALSAAYWAASSCKTVRASELGETGSIGVIATFTSVARALKEQGIDVHIERSGSQKALLHPSEALSEQGKSYLKEKVTYLHAYFIENIEASRPKLKQVSRDVWAEGKTYFANEAIEIGLVDGPVISLGALISKLNSVNTSKVNQGTPMAKQILLSEAAQAQVALGVPLENVEHTELAEPPADPTPEPVPTEAPAQPVAQAAETTPAVATAQTTELTAFLKEQLESNTVKLLQLQSELADVRGKLAQMADVEAKLQPIAIEAINRIQVALGQTPSTLAGLPATSLAEQYSAVKAEFDSRFKAGRQSTGAVDPAQQGRSLEEMRLQLVPTAK